MVSQLEDSEKSLVKDRRWQIPLKSWRFLIVTVLLIGIFFRFANLGNKVFYFDETQPILKISGYTGEQWSSVNSNLNGQIVSINK